MLIIHPTDLNRGLNWFEIFQNDHPLKLEIGFGTGQFLIGLASQDSQCNYVGIEKLRRYVHKARKKIEAKGLCNIRLIHGEAVSILQRAFGKKKLQEVYINFPDPWPKRRHRRRRIIQPGFIESITQVLEEGGKVSLATDVPDYAWQMFHCLQGHGAFRNLFFENPFAYSMQGRFPTKYESEFQKQGRQIYYLLFQKTGGESYLSEQGFRD